MTPKERSDHVRELANSLPPMSTSRAALHMAAGYVDQTAKELSQEMRRLIVAARVVAFENQSLDAIKELGDASEAFAEAVPWEDEPESLTPAAPQPNR